MKEQVRAVMDVLQRIFIENGELLLAPTIPSSFAAYSSPLFELGYSFRPTITYDYTDSEIILSKIIPGTKPALQFIRCFQSFVWLSIFVSILMNSLINSMSTSSPRKIFAYFWNYFELLFSDSIQSLLKNKQNKLILGIWMMSACYLAICFTSFMMDHMIQTEPIIKIENIEDLAQRTEITAFARQDGTLAAYFEQNDNDITRMFKGRLKTFEDFNDVFNDVLTGLRNGSSALIHDRILVLFHLIEFETKQIGDKNLPRLSDTLHISEQFMATNPVFSMFNSETDNEIYEKFNEL